MRVLKYNLNLAFITLKSIMAYGVSTLKVVPRGQAKSVKVLEPGQKAPETVPKCSPNSNVIAVNESSINESEPCDDGVFYTCEIEVPTSPPEVELEVEVESTDNSIRRAKAPRSKRHCNYTQSPLHKISTINRRSRLWAKQMRRRRRRMSFFDGVQRYRLRYPLPKRWNTITSSIPARVDVNILKLLQNKRKQLKRDGLYQFVLWREALKAERNRLLGPKSVFG